MKKTDLASLLKKVVAQYKSPQGVGSNKILESTGEAGGSIQPREDETPSRIEDLSKIRSTKTTKAVLKMQLELYRNLLPDIPTSDQLEEKKKAELVELLVDAVNHYKSLQNEEHTKDR